MIQAAEAYAADRPWEAGWHLSSPVADVVAVTSVGVAGVGAARTLLWASRQVVRGAPAVSGAVQKRLSRIGGVQRESFAVELATVDRGLVRGRELEALAYARGLALKEKQGIRFSSKNRVPAGGRFEPQHAKGVPKPLTLGFDRQRAAGAAPVRTAAATDPDAIVYVRQQRGHHPVPALTDSSRVKGDFGEAAARRHSIRAGRILLPCKLPSNQGFDLVSVKFKPDGSVKDIWIIESKYSGKKQAQLAPGQMTEKWIDDKLKAMAASRNPDLKNTAKLIEAHQDRVRYIGNVLGSDGINQWKPLTKKIERLHQKPKS